MKGTDKFLIGIIAGIGLLVVVALVVTLSKPEETYQNENTPESVVHDYLLALQKKDYVKAYSFISSSIPGYPRTEGKFVSDIDNYAWNLYAINNHSFSIDSREVKVKGENATVVVGATSLGGRSLVDSRQNYRTFQVDLKQVKGEWKITHSDQYFAYCWSDIQGCK